MKEVNNLQDYVAEICKLQSLLKRDGGMHYETLLFRGQDDVKYQILPSIGRGRDHMVDISIMNEERNLIEMAKYKLPEIFNHSLYPIELLALLQHYGIPTRLLDLTENAFVALYFTCCKNDNADGEIIIFKHNETNVTNYPVANAIAESYIYSDSTFTPLSLFYEDVLTQDYFSEQRRSLNACYTDKDEGGNWIKECCQKPMFIYAPVRTERQQNQFGRYLLFPNVISNECGYDSFTKLIAPLSKDDTSIVERIVIKKELKKQIINDLKLFGISEENLFSDNADKVCEGIVKISKERIRG